MAYNGSGTFARLYNWVNDRNANVKIRADRMDAEMDGFATGLSTAITKDGQTTITAAIPMNNQKLTGLAAPTASGDAVNLTTAQTMGGLRNLIINGDFRVNQRAFAGGAVAANAYWYDRWKAGSGGATVTVSGRLATITANAVRQDIDGNSIKTGTHVINWTGTAICTVDAVSKAKGDTFTLTAGTNAVCIFSGGTLGEVQVEFGTLPTTFEVRPLPLETAMCQRYYSLTDANLQLPAIGSGICQINFPATMRASPTTAVVTAGTLTNATVATEAFGATTRGAGFQITTTVANGFVISRVRSHDAEI